MKRIVLNVFIIKKGKTKFAVGLVNDVMIYILLYKRPYVHTRLLSLTKKTRYYFPKSMSLLSKGIEREEQHKVFKVGSSRS